jgi:predicted nucleic acid-binding protein
VPDRALLDTDVLVEYLRDRPGAAEFLEGFEGELLVSAATVAELFAGVRDQAEEEALGSFLSAFDLLPISSALAREGGRLRRRYGPSHGVGLMDAIIAATAQETGARLYTFNVRHFPMLPDAGAPYPRA